MCVVQGIRQNSLAAALIFNCGQLIKEKLYISVECCSTLVGASTYKIMLTSTPTYIPIISAILSCLFLSIHQDILNVVHLNQSDANNIKLYRHKQMKGHQTNRGSRHTL